MLPPIHELNWLKQMITSIVITVMVAKVIFRIQNRTFAIDIYFVATQHNVITWYIIACTLHRMVCKVEDHIWWSNRPIYVTNWNPVSMHLTHAPLNMVMRHWNKEILLLRHVWIYFDTSWLHSHVEYREWICLTNKHELRIRLKTKQFCIYRPSRQRCFCEMFSKPVIPEQDLL